MSNLEEALYLTEVVLELAFGAASIITLLYSNSIVAWWGAKQATRGFKQLDSYLTSQATSGGSVGEKHRWARDFPMVCEFNAEQTKKFLYWTNMRGRLYWVVVPYALTVTVPLLVLAFMGKQVPDEYHWSHVVIWGLLFLGVLAWHWAAATAWASNMLRAESLRIIRFEIDLRYPGRPRGVRLAGVEITGAYQQGAPLHDEVSEKVNGS